MSTPGYATYDPLKNQLQILRPGETITRFIACTNFNPRVDKVHGVQINGDEIWLVVGPLNNPRPNRKFLYRFSSLIGGASQFL